MLHRLIYFSSSNGIDFEGARQIGEHAAVHNARCDVSGVLMLREGWFVQVLEGTRLDVAATLGRIAVDPRHGGLTVVSAEDVTSRLFSQTWMGLLANDHVVAEIIEMTLGISKFDPCQVSGAAFVDLANTIAARGLVALDVDQADYELV